MTNVIQPFHLLVIALAGWLNRHQQAVIDYLIEENRVLKEQLEGQRRGLVTYYVLFIIHLCRERLGGMLNYYYREAA